MRYCPLCRAELVKSYIDGIQRLCCPSPTCNYVFWDNPVPVVAAVVELNGAVVLARNKCWPPRYFGLITGFLERGETPEAAVLREVKEELGLQGKIESFIGYYSFMERNQLILAFHVTAQGEITMGEELAEVKLVPPEKLRPWPSGTGIALQDWLRQRIATGQP